MFKTKEELAKVCLADIEMLKERHFNMITNWSKALMIAHYTKLLYETIDKYKTIVAYLEKESLNNKKTITIKKQKDLTYYIQQIKDTYISIKRYLYLYKIKIQQSFKKNL